MKREQMNIVVTGHVDHGKSTVVGRLLADTGSLPEGKLEQVKTQCLRNARPFEYAFLLDALKEEQAQGITIDTARCFFKTEKRDYIIIDAPGHVEFLKNMVSGAARAEAALLVIDAHEGIAENSRRHGYLVHMLGIRKIIVLVNKMDLVDYREDVFLNVVNEYAEFLRKLNIVPVAFVPVSALDGDNIAQKSTRLKWYTGKTVLGVVDDLPVKVPDNSKPFRMPVQDIYKFTEAGDQRRIFAGTIESGNISNGDRVVFYPSQKRSVITSIEGFNEPEQGSVCTGKSTGFTLADELYIKRGEIMCKDGELSPQIAVRFHANVFWMGISPLVKDRKYKLKCATAAHQVRLVDILSSVDATDLSAVVGKETVERHDVAECLFETVKPLAFDCADDIPGTGRFVIVDNYDIAGGGIITGAEISKENWADRHVISREKEWESGFITTLDREKKNGHRSKFIIITGNRRVHQIARLLEMKLFGAGLQAYYASIYNVELMNQHLNSTEDLIAQLGELARLITGAGLIFITSLQEFDDGEIDLLRKLNQPNDVLVVRFDCSDQLLTLTDDIVDNGAKTEEVVSRIVDRLRSERIIADYDI